MNPVVSANSKGHARHPCCSTRKQSTDLHRVLILSTQCPVVQSLCLSPMGFCILPSTRVSQDHVRKRTARNHQTSPPPVSSESVGRGSFRETPRSQTAGLTLPFSICNAHGGSQWICPRSIRADTGVSRPTQTHHANTPVGTSAASWPEGAHDCRAIWHNFALLATMPRS